MSTAIQTFRAEVRRSKDWWVVTVPELERVYTQVKSLSQVEAMVAEVIELVHELDPLTFAVSVHILAEDFIGEQFEQFLSARDAHLEAFERSTKATVDLARRLVGEEGFTQADAGAIMGLSAQRVSQLLKANEPRIPEDA